MDSANPKEVLWPGGRQLGRSWAWGPLSPPSPLATEYKRATDVNCTFIDECVPIAEKDWDKLIPTREEWILKGSKK